MNRREDEWVHEQLDPPSFRHSRKAYLGIGIALIVLVILGGLLATHLFEKNSPSQESTHTLFYISTSPGWGSITMNGQTIAHLPTPGVDQPLTLSAGAYEVIWHAAPFSPQSCTLMVPVDITTTRCLSGNTLSVPGHPDQKAFVLTFTASTATLSNSQRLSLFQAAQAALVNAQSSEIVQPGEHYVNLQASHLMATASQPLRAMLRFQLDTNSGSNAPCMGNNLSSAPVCSNLGQNCHLLCVEGDPSALPPSQSMNVYGMIHPIWEYTTMTGQVIARDQPDAPEMTGTEYLASFALTWDGTQWHVAINSSTDPELVPPACAAASAIISQQATLQHAESDPTINVTWRFAAGPNQALGCLAEAFQYQLPHNTATPITAPQRVASGLYRFGVLLAVDATAHHYWPDLPVASAYEQSLARQLETQPAH